MVPPKQKWNNIILVDKKAKTDEEEDINVILNKAINRIARIA